MAPDLVLHFLWQNKTTNQKPRNVEEQKTGFEFKLPASSGSHVMSTSAGAGEPAANFFPLTTIADALKLFKAQLEQPDPSLALLSIVAGALEHQWTQVSLYSHMSKA